MSAPGFQLICVIFTYSYAFYGENLLDIGLVEVTSFGILIKFWFFIYLFFSHLVHDSSVVKGVNENQM